VQRRFDYVIDTQYQSSLHVNEILKRS